MFTEAGAFISPDERDLFFKLDETKCMINVGSVGQPRDGNPKSCFVVLDDEEKTVEYHRIEYDWEKTKQKIYDIPDLENMLGDRLLTGR